VIIGFFTVDPILGLLLFLPESPSACETLRSLVLTFSLSLYRPPSLCILSIRKPPKNEVVLFQDVLRLPGRRFISQKDVLSFQSILKIDRYNPPPKVLSFYTGKSPEISVDYTVSQNCAKWRHFFRVVEVINIFKKFVQIFKVPSKMSNQLSYFLIVRCLNSWDVLRHLKDVLKTSFQLRVVSWCQGCMSQWHRKHSSFLSTHWSYQTLGIPEGRSEEGISVVSPYEWRVMCLQPRDSPWNLVSPKRVTGV